GLITDLKEGKKNAKKIGYPVMIKATAGGGGKGIRIISDETDLENAMQQAKAEARASFSNDGIYLEKFIEEPRHIEIQIAGDQYGNVIHLSERECSIQRRMQKLVEESPSPFVDDKLRKKMGTAAIKAAKSIQYESLGTVEFLVDKYKNFYFMEMNTRIQVEHPVTEEVIDHDLVKEQIKIAAGVKLKGKIYLPQLFAIECRINAEDPYKDFIPCPGKIISFHTPKGHGVRVDTHAYAGYTVPPYYDSLIAKVICKAKTRDAVIAKMDRALNEFIVEGVKTTIPFHIALMRNDEFKEGNFTTSFVETFEF
ncbi:MAG: acetyl-CoA carboxylase biotin carboxylase subunit, partial [Caldiserica bacterium]